MLIGLALLATVMLLAHALNPSRQEYRERIRHRKKADDLVSPLMRERKKQPAAQPGR